MVGCTYIYRAHAHSDGKEFLPAVSLQEVGVRDAFQWVSRDTPVCTPCTSTSSKVWVCSVTYVVPRVILYTRYVCMVSTATPFTLLRASSLSYHDTHHLYLYCFSTYLCPRTVSTTIESIFVAWCLPVSHAVIAPTSPCYCCWYHLPSKRMWSNSSRIRPFG